MSLRFAFGKKYTIENPASYKYLSYIAENPNGKKYSAFKSKRIDIEERKKCEYLIPVFFLPSFDYLLAL
jgi:hypothetical protein